MFVRFTKQKIGVIRFIFRTSCEYPTHRKADWPTVLQRDGPIRFLIYKQRVNFSFFLKFQRVYDGKLLRFEHLNHWIRRSLTGYVSAKIFDGTRLGRNENSEIISHLFSSEAVFRNYFFFLHSIENGPQYRTDCTCRFPGVSFVNVITIFTQNYEIDNRFRRGFHDLSHRLFGTHATHTRGHLQHDTRDGLRG